MPELHETMLGQKLIQSTLPNIADSLRRIADQLEKKNNKPEKSLHTAEIDFQAECQELYEFLEYEEAYSVDPTTQRRIRTKLVELKVWPESKLNLD